MTDRWAGKERKEGRGRRREGRGTGAGSAGTGDGSGGRAAVHRHGEEERLTAAELGAALGERASLVQFSSAFCAPCRATRRILGEVAGLVPGVAHIEIDAEARLELVRDLGVRRTPTVLVLDSGGRVVRRAAGQPRKADVIAALGEAV
ncbi:thioredoxin family protein [Streptomyces sp. MUM 2J]|uniref:TlpA family protein disulfide reductase n=1 Tax=Streptomyces sp. MUM 2J TaxID=2791987 RepID=UPI001F04D7C3|nr:thioredoxin family protein [Streptomyces sp. MUM 2J]MCH0562393.1 thioredoxin family protein [Streptomyces sp. MUM 2J]